MWKGLQRLCRIGWANTESKADLNVPSQQIKPFGRFVLRLTCFHSGLLVSALLVVQAKLPVVSAAACPASYSLPTSYIISSLHIISPDMQLQRAWFSAESKWNLARHVSCFSMFRALHNDLGIVLSPSIFSQVSDVSPSLLQNVRRLIKRNYYVMYSKNSIYQCVARFS